MAKMKANTHSMTIDMPNLIQILIDLNLAFHLINCLKQSLTGVVNNLLVLINIVLK
jgi:hypothetical protein